MAQKLPNAATAEELLRFARTFFPKPDDLVKIQYDRSSRGVRATLIVTARIFRAIDDESTYQIIDGFAKEMQDRGVGGGDRPFVNLQAA